MWYHDLVGGLAERGQDEEGLGRDGAALARAVVAGLQPAALQGELLVLQQLQELALLEAQQRRVVCRQREPHRLIQIDNKAV